MRGSSFLLAASLLAACTVEREAPPAPRVSGSPADPAIAAPRPAEAAEAAGQALEAMVRPEARDADAPPIAEPPAPEPRRAATVKLLDPGAEPREKVRLAPAVGQAQKLTLELGMEVAMQLGRQAVAPQAVPGLHVDVDLKVEGREPDGTTRYSLSVVDVRVDSVDDVSARVREAMQKTITELAGARGEATVGPRGVPQAFALEAEPRPDVGVEPTFAGLREVYAHLFVALPEEAVGPGARWEVVSHSALSGLPIQRVATYTLRSRDGDRLALDVAIAEHATSRAEGVDEPAAGPAPIQATGHQATGTGELQIDLDRIAPRSGALTSRSTTQLQAALGGNPQAVLMQQSIDAAVAER